MASLARRVSSKLEVGDLKGAVRLASSDSVLAEKNGSTLQALKHSSHPDSAFPPAPTPLPQDDEIFAISEEMIVGAIRSFSPGSAGGPDGLSPQHLKDMIHVKAHGGASVLLTALW